MQEKLQLLKHIAQEQNHFIHVLEDLRIWLVLIALFICVGIVSGEERWLVCLVLIFLSGCELISINNEIRNKSRESSEIEKEIKTLEKGIKYKGESANE